MSLSDRAFALKCRASSVASLAHLPSRCRADQCVHLCVHREDEHAEEA